MTPPYDGILTNKKQPEKTVGSSQAVFFVQIHQAGVISPSLTVRPDA